jgi:hypothetical protein
VQDHSRSVDCTRQPRQLYESHGEPPGIQRKTNTSVLIGGASLAFVTAAGYSIENTA